MALRSGSLQYGSIVGRARSRTSPRTCDSCLSASIACLAYCCAASSTSCTCTTCRISWYLAGLVPRLAGKKVILDVHDSVPETFAAKFSKVSMFHRLLCLEERWSARVAHRVICVNHPQRETLVGRGIPAAKTSISMNVPDPRLFGAVA